jgi:hypothetical protein
MTARRRLADKAVTGRVFPGSFEKQKRRLASMCIDLVDEKDVSERAHWIVINCI